MVRSHRTAFRSVGSLVTVLVVGACVGDAGSTRGGPRAGVVAQTGADTASTSSASRPQGAQEQILRGRLLVVSHACGGCHGGGADPAAEGYLAGMRKPSDEFLIGPCAMKPGAKPCFHTRPRNLTPDNASGLGRFTERQIFNALRYGLRPGETPDVEITSAEPGKGNFPENPKYLAPPMPWPQWRHMSDQELWDIAAYLKYGVKPVRNRVPDSEGPPDFWASQYTPEKIGPYPLPPFPTEREQLPK